MTALEPAIRDILKTVSTATLCTQLFKRGLRNVFIQGASRLTKTAPGNLVGPAFTVRNIPAREDLEQLSAFRDPEHPQRKSIETIPPGSVMVIDEDHPGRLKRCGTAYETRVAGFRSGANGIHPCIALKQNGARDRD